MNRAARMLVVFPGALGDFLLLAPALAALRARGVAIEVSVRRALGDLAAALFPGCVGPPADGAAMRSLFTTALDPTLAAWLRGATRLDVWFAASDALEAHARALGVVDVRRHAVERDHGGPHASVAYAAVYGVTPVAPPSPHAWLRDAALEPTRWNVGGVVAPAGRRLVVHPGAGAAAKRWSAEGFRRIADAWRARGGVVTVLLGPAEAGEAAAWRATAHAVACELELRAAAVLVASATWYVGNDSGLSHLAGLLERRGAVLFGPTDPARWKPFGGALVPISFDRAGDESDVVAQVLAALAQPPRSS